MSIDDPSEDSEPFDGPGPAESPAPASESAVPAVASLSDPALPPAAADVGATVAQLLLGPDGLDSSPALDPLGASRAAIADRVHRARHLDAIWWSFLAAVLPTAFAVMDFDEGAFLVTIPWLLVCGYKLAEVQCRAIATEAGVQSFDRLPPAGYLRLAGVGLGLGAVGGFAVYLAQLAFAGILDGLSDYSWGDEEVAAAFLCAPIAWYLFAFLAAFWSRGLVALVFGRSGEVGWALREAVGSSLRPVSTDLRFALYAVLLSIGAVMLAGFVGRWDSEAQATLMVFTSVVVSAHISIAYPVFVVHELGLASERRARPHEQARGA